MCRSNHCGGCSMPTWCYEWITGDYRVQDDALAEWLRNQELED